MKFDPRKAFEYILRLRKWSARGPTSKAAISHQKAAMLEGMQFVEAILRSKGFRFHFRAEGKGAGGQFAWGEFVRKDRRLELHYRWNLGLVRYHAGDQSVSHESYMRELGVSDQCEYPGFSGVPEDAFRGLAHDLTLADDFVIGSAVILRQAAAKERVDATRRFQADEQRYVGDTRALNELRSLFREGRYNEVLQLAKSLKYPDRMAHSERRMVEIAQARSGD